MTRPTSIGRTFPRVAGLGIITTTIGDLADVDLSGISDGDIIIWDEDTGTWVVGPQAGADGMVPYFIDTGETFTVPEFKQALFAMTIDVLGTLAVDGYLIEVD